MPALEPLPDHRERIIVVGTSVRKNLTVLQAHFQSLAWQRLPPRTRLHFIYVPDFPATDDAEQFLRAWVGERGGEILRGIPGTLGDFREGPQTHEWTSSAMRRVGANKSKIIRRALELKADALFFCDTDLILDTTTLASLISCEKPIATAVYWTKWVRSSTETNIVRAGPQVWLRMPYLLDGRGMDEAEFRGKLINRELTRVYGFGACTLIQRSVLEAGVDFSPAPDFPQEGMFAGEDRQFSIKCERLHIDAWADPWPDIFHIYHLSDDVPHIPAMALRLSGTHARRAGLGDLVSLRLLALEPVPINPTQWSHMPPQFPRGRLGTLPLMPEIEEAVYGLDRGDKVIVRVHCPITHPMPFLRGRTRLIEVTLIDCKPFGASPVIEAELYIRPQSQRVTDTLTLTPPQQVMLAEDAIA